MILFSSLPFSLNGEGCLVKNALGTISIVEQLVQHKHDFVLTAGQGLGICCSGTQTAVRKQDKGRREHLSKLTLWSTLTKTQACLCSCRVSVNTSGQNILLLARKQLPQIFPLLLPGHCIAVCSSRCSRLLTSPSSAPSGVTSSSHSHSHKHALHTQLSQVLQKKSVI